METVEIGMEQRTAHGKGAARRLRASGRIPAVLYGPSRVTTQVSVEQIEFERKVASLEGTHLIQLRGSGDLASAVVLLKEMQEHPVTGRVLHADFLEVDLTKRITVTISVHFVGRAVGMVAGGILQPVLREVEVECLPTQIPDFIEVDVSPLEIHGSIHVRDLALPGGVTAVTDAAQTVVTIAAPITEAEPTAAEEGAVAGGTPAAAAGDAEPNKS